MISTWRFPRIDHMLQVALEVLSKDIADWFLWLDCDALVTNRSISIADFLQTYLVTEDAHFVVAEDSNSRVLMVRNGAVGFMSWEILAPNPYISHHLIIRRRQASTLAFSCCVGVKWDCDS